MYELSSTFVIEYPTANSIFSLVIPSKGETSLNLTVSLVERPCAVSLTVMTFVPCPPVEKESLFNIRATGGSVLAGLALRKPCASPLNFFGSS